VNAPARPALRYHGGKFRLAPWLIGFFPPHRIYVEPFGGGASVLLQKPRSHGEVYNDLDAEVVNVFRVLRDPYLASALQKAVWLTPFSRDELTLAFQPADDPVEQARRTVTKAFLGFGSDAIHRPAPRGLRTAISTGLRSRSRANGSSPARDFAGWPDRIHEFTERLRGVVIENKPALQIIEQFDAEGVLLYVDPPYPKSTRQTADRNGYRHELTDEQHGELAQRLRRARAYVAISSYPSELYERLYDGWERYETTAYADAKRRPRTEVLWISPACSAALQVSRAQGELLAVGGA